MGGTDEAMDAAGLAIHRAEPGKNKGKRLAWPEPEPENAREGLLEKIERPGGGR